MTTTKSIDSYRLTDMARKANADATKRFFDEIEKAAATIR